MRMYNNDEEYDEYEDEEYDEYEVEEVENVQPTQEVSVTGPWVWAILALLYMVSPIDIIPDIPVIGWLDDLCIAGTGLLNLMQAYSEQSNSYFAGILKTLKRIMIIVSILVIVVVGLIVLLIVKLFT